MGDWYIFWGRDRIMSIPGSGQTANWNVEKFESEEAALARACQLLKTGMKVHELGTMIGAEKFRKRDAESIALYCADH